MQRMVVVCCGMMSNVMNGMRETTLISVPICNADKRKHRDTQLYRHQATYARLVLENNHFCCSILII